MIVAVFPFVPHYLTYAMTMTPHLFVPPRTHEIQVQESFRQEQRQARRLDREAQRLSLLDQRPNTRAGLHSSSGSRRARRARDPALYHRQHDTWDQNRAHRSVRAMKSRRSCGAMPVAAVPFKRPVVSGEREQREKRWRSIRNGIEPLKKRYTVTTRKSGDMIFRET